jgi:ubiquitin-protein ligase
VITFSCFNCGRSFTVNDDLAGRRAHCKKCGATLVIPAPVAVEVAQPDRIVITFDEAAPPSEKPAVNPAPPPIPEAREVVKPDSQPGKRLSPRARRLLADAEQVRAGFRDFPLIRIRSITGDPPDLYQVEYRVRGLTRGPDGKPVYQDEHLMEMQLTYEYPRQGPKCRMLTPIFHPNFEPAMICVGDNWTAGERLVDLIVRIGEMITYQAYSIKSPLDGEAAMWADQNKHRLPIDNRDLTPPALD